MRTRTVRRKLALADARLKKVHVSSLWPDRKLPGSPHPFKRIQALLEAAKKAAYARMSAMEKLHTVLNRGFWQNLLTAVVPALEKRAEKLMSSGKTEFDEKDRELMRAGRALLEYQFRGHGRAQYTPRLRIAPRSKYKPHQGARECARRVKP